MTNTNNISPVIDECGKHEIWNEETWLHKTILHIKGQWDEEIVCCSRACMDNWIAKDGRRKKQA